MYVNISNAMTRTYILEKLESVVEWDQGYISHQRNGEHGNTFFEWCDETPGALDNFYFEGLRTTRRTVSTSSTSRFYFSFLLRDCETGVTYSWSTQEDLLIANFPTSLQVALRCAPSYFPGFPIQPVIRF